MTPRGLEREAAASLAAEAGIAIEHVARAMSVRRRSSPRCWRSVASIPVWFM
jgi:hypothetical protein